MNQTQIESLLRILLAAGGPVAGLLTNYGMAPGQVNNWLTILLIVLPPLGSAIWGLYRNTDKQNVAKVAAMPTEAANAAVASLPAEAQTAIKIAAMPDKAILAAANSMPDVVAVVTKTGATDGVAAATADPALSKVMSETSAAKP